MENNAINRTPEQVEAAIKESRKEAREAWKKMYTGRPVDALKARKLTNDNSRYIDGTFKYIDISGQEVEAPFTGKIASLLAPTTVQELKDTCNKLRRLSAKLPDLSPAEQDKVREKAQPLVDEVLRLYGCGNGAAKAKDVRQILAHCYKMDKAANHNAIDAVIPLEWIAKAKLEGRLARNAYEDKLRMQEATKDNASTDSINAAINGTTTETEMVKREAKQAKQEPAA